MHKEAELKKFMGELNKCLSTLKFTYGVIEKKRVAFLDANVCLENGSITTDVHTTSTDFHQ